jgi:hypothetical protein
MKLSFWCLSILLLSAPLHAEIYKWKDKDGSIRYSDIPPPSNIKNEPMLGNKIPKVSSQPVIADVPVVKGGAVAKEGAPLNQEDAAAKRAKDADAQKKLDETKQAELKFRQESCAAAKRDFAMFNNGGRIVTTDAKGERQYLGDEDIAKNKEKAQQAVDKFCVD